MPQFAAVVAGIGEGKGGNGTCRRYKNLQWAQQAGRPQMNKTFSWSLLIFHFLILFLQIVLFKDANVEIDENGISNFQ